jgi:TnpA family transposase
VRRGLNKGESVYRLARAVAIGQDGEMRERELYDQMNRASCLMGIFAYPPKRYIPASSSPVSRA